MSAIYWFTAKTVNDQGQEMPLQAGRIERMVIYHPGKQVEAMAYFQAQNFGSPGVRYGITAVAVKGAYPEPIVMAVQISLGPGRQVSPRDFPLSATHVQGGQPVGLPEGQRQDRPDGYIDPRGHFQALSDQSLPVERDSMFGSGADGTYTDLVRTGLGFQEKERQL